MKAYELWLRVSARSRSSTLRRSSRLGRSARLEQRGASAVEYGLLIAGIAAMIAVVVFAFGGGANGLFHGSCSTIIENTSNGSCS